MVSTTGGGAEQTDSPQPEVAKSEKEPADVEDKGGEASAKQPPKTKRSSLGLFRGAAISVLSKVIESKEEECAAMEVKQAPNVKAGIKDTRSMSLEDPETSKVREVLHSVKSRRRSTLADLGAIDQVIQNAHRRRSISDSDENVRRPSLSSIVGIVTLRKMYMSKNQHSRRDSQPTSKPKLDLSEIKPEEMPETPRFGATLSQEAQYATLSCYGDKVLNYLKMAGHSAWQRTSDRTQTPTDSGRLLMDEQNADGSKVTLPSIDNGSRRSKVPMSGGSHKTPKSKDLKVTHRLEYVMDILDKVKSAEGGITTTPRVRIKDIDPIQHGESWLLSWDTEFMAKEKDAE